MTSTDDKTNDKTNDNKPQGNKPGNKPGNKQGNKRGNKRRWLAGGVAALIVLAAGAAWQMRMFSPPPQETADGPSAVVIQEFERRLEMIERHLADDADNDKPEVVPVASNELWWIAETERYLMEAGERLNSGGAVKSVLSALRAARQTLEGADIAAAAEVKATLDMEIQLLSEYRNAAAEQALEAIDALLKQFGSAKTPGGEPSGNGAAPADGSARSAGAWAQFTDALAERFERLVVVQRNADAETRQVTQGVTVRSLVLARTAVLGGDSISYRYALANALQALEQHDEIDDALYDKLQALYALDIAGTPPRIGEALAGIHALAAEMTP